MSQGLLFGTALRFLLKGKKGIASNIITWVAFSGICFSTAAIICVLTVFNGMQVLINDLFSGMDPKLSIVSNQGSRFMVQNDLTNQLKKVPEISAVALTLEAKAMAEYGNNRHIVRLKGVDSVFTKVNSFTSFLVEGKYKLYSDSLTCGGIAGSGVAWYLNLPPGESETPVNLYTFSSLPESSDPAASVIKAQFFPEGVFAMQKEYDDQYLIVPLSFLWEFLGKGQEISAIELALKPGIDPSEFRNQTDIHLPEGLVFKTGIERHESLFRIAESEKWVTFFLLLLMAIIAGVNIISCLSLLVLEKQRGLGILSTMGLSPGAITRVILYAGLLIGVAAILTGILLGSIFYWTQAEFGWLKLSGGESFVVQSYPVQFKIWDAVIVAFSVFLLTGLSAWLPARRAGKMKIIDQLMR
jgi:lipoprotein-releasing system permease protein